MLEAILGLIPAVMMLCIVGGIIARAGIHD